MNTTRTLSASFLLAAAAVVCLGDAITDAELKQDVWEYLTTRFCGSRGGRRIAHPRILTDYIRFDGNTNRLAAVLVEVACSNNTWAAGRAFKELEKYGTEEQLPFLYSCATNPAVANRAVNAVLRIEGVTSNSVEMVCRYLEITNVSESVHWDHVEVFKMMFDMLGDNAPPSDKELVLGCIMRHAPENRRCPRQLDEVILSADTGYRFSKRRLSVLRGVYLRGLNEFQLPYVTNAINELVAYPEANLPD